MKIARLQLLVLPVALFIACGKKGNETKPERRNITETVFASGTLEPEEKYNLTAQTEGYITHLKFEQGDTIMEGQVLAIIDNQSSLISASSSENLLNIASLNASSDGPPLKQALHTLELARERMLQDSMQNMRYQKLIISNSVSKLESENIRLAWETSRANYLNAVQNYKLQQQTTEQQLIAQRSQRDVNKVSGDFTQLKAVLGGKVYKRLKEAGDYVRRGDVIAIIGSERDLFAKLSIDESNIIHVKNGQAVTIQLNTNKSKTYKGTITEIYPAFDEATQSFLCKAKFEEDPELKIAGTLLQANIITANKLNVLVIPRKYLDYGNKVILKGSKEPVTVKTGFLSSEWVEILDGIKESDVLINPLH